MKLVKSILISVALLATLAACELELGEDIVSSPDSAQPVATVAPTQPQTIVEVPEVEAPEVEQPPIVVNEVTTPEQDEVAIMGSGDYTPRESLPEPVREGLRLIRRAAGDLTGTQIIINPEEQIMYHVVNGNVRAEYKVSTGRGSVSSWVNEEWSFLGNGEGTQRSSTGYMTTIGAEATVCDIDEIAAQWTPTTCYGEYAQTTWDKPGDPLWSDNVLHGELTTVVLRMYPQERSNSNNMARGILIHGTNKYASVDLQIPASRGCTRMMPVDILDLAAHLDEGVNQIYVLDRQPTGISFDEALRNTQ